MVNKKTTIQELIVIILFCAYLVVSVLNSTQFKNMFDMETIFKTLNLLILITLSLNIIHFKPFTTNQLLLLLVLLGMGFIIAITSDRKMEIIIPLMFMINGVFLRNGTYVRAYFWTLLFAVLLTVFLAFIGVFTEDALIENRAIRYYFGFNYTLFLPNFFSHLVIAFISLKKKSVTIWETIIALTLNQIIYHFTNGRGPYIVVLLAIVGLWIIRLFPYIWQSIFTRRIVYSCVTVLAILSIGISYIYSEGNYYLSKIDRVLSGRIKLGHQGIEQYGLSVFGKEIEWQTGRLGIERSGDYFYVDSSYLKIALMFGMLFLAFLVIAYTLLLISSYNVQNYYLLFALLLVVVHGFTDDVFFDLRYNPYLLLIGGILFKNINTIINPETW